MNPTMDSPTEDNTHHESETPMDMRASTDAEGGSISSCAEVVVSDDEIEEVSDSIFKGFQIVRSEFFSQLREPAVAFSQGKIAVNSACLKKLPNVDFAQILVNREKKMLAIRPCQESDIFSFQWCTHSAKDGKRRPRQVSGKMFFLKICSLMGWNLDYRYKILGKLVRANNEYLFLFDLEAAQTFIRKDAAEGKNTKFSRTPLYPKEWQNQFGIPYEEHQKALQINIFHGFAVYSIKEDSAVAPDQHDAPSEQIQPPHRDFRRE